MSPEAAERTRKPRLAFLIFGPGGAEKAGEVAAVRDGAIRGGISGLREAGTGGG